MSELLLYIIATALVLAGVAYFFVKQREQELAAAKEPNTRGKTPKQKKEPKEPKERSSKPRKVRPAKEEKAPVPLTKKQLKALNKEEDETKDVLDFLKNRKITSDATQERAQVKIRTAAPVDKKAEAAKSKAAAKPSKTAQPDSDTDDEDEQTDYVTIKRKQTTKPTKEAEEPAPEVAPTEEGTTKKKKNAMPKFFTVQEKEQWLAEKEKGRQDYLAREAEREARKNRPPGEKRERRPRRAEGGEEGADGFTTQTHRERRPRRERVEGEEGEGAEGEGRSKYPPREPDVAPPFASEYETAEMDHILNNLTSYYDANPEANVSRPKPRSQPKAAEAEVEEATQE